MSYLQAHEVWHRLLGRNKQFNSLQFLTFNEPWAIKKSEVTLFAGKWTNLEPITLSKITQPQKDKHNGFPAKCNSYLTICLLSFFCHLFIIYLNHLPCICLLIILSIYLVSTIYLSPIYLFYLSFSMYYICCKSRRGTIWWKERSLKKWRTRKKLGEKKDKHGMSSFICKI